MDKEIIVKYISGSLKELERTFKNEHINFGNSDLTDIFDDEYYFPYNIYIRLEGSSGASCWDDEPSVYYEAYGEHTDRPDLENLALKTIKKFNPKLSLVESAKIIEKVLSEEENSSDDYYGNYSSSVNISLDTKLLINEIEKSL